MLMSILVVSYKCLHLISFFFFKQKTAYEMRISDWSSDVCSSDLLDPELLVEITQDVLVMRFGKEGENVLGDRRPDAVDVGQFGEIGRASCRERVCQYV